MPELDWTGTPVRISGFNFFVRCYVRVLRVAGTPLTLPPPAVLPYPLKTFEAYQSGNNARCAWTYPTQPTGHTYDVQILRQGPYSIARQPDFHHAAIAACPGIATTPYDDPLTLGGRYSYWARVLDATTGLVSPALLSSFNFLFTAGPGSLTGRCIHPELSPIPDVLVTYNGTGIYTNELGIFLFWEVLPGDYTCFPAVWQGPWTPESKPAHVVSGETCNIGDFIGPPE
jgi:hypothetical protein